MPKQESDELFTTFPLLISILYRVSTTIDVAEWALQPAKPLILLIFRNNWSRRTENGKNKKVIVVVICYSMILDQSKHYVYLTYGTIQMVTLN